MMTKEAARPNAPGLDRILRAAVKHDFPVNILCWGNVDAGTALIDRHPDTRFIIDHLAILQPRTPPAPLQPWADLPKVLDLAKRKNALIKVSGACTLCTKSYRFQTFRDPLARVFDAGVSSAACGARTGHAHMRPSSTTSKPSNPSSRLTASSDSERAMLMGGACAKAYCWSPKKGAGSVTTPCRIRRVTERLADIDRSSQNVRFWPKADMSLSGGQCRRYWR